jgi:hypothetical protein
MLVLFDVGSMLLRAVGVIECCKGTVVDCLEMLRPVGAGRRLLWDFVCCWQIIGDQRTLLCTIYSSSKLLKPVTEHICHAIYICLSR